MTGAQKAELLALVEEAQKFHGGYRLPGWPIHKLRMMIEVIQTDGNVGGHHALCDVFDLAPDLGPSQKPCNCRRMMKENE